jgi:hypothetical protein
MTPELIARLACGCRVTVREAGPGAPLAVVLDRKADTCTMAIHVGGMPLFDHRVAMRTPTRQGEPAQPDYEDG